MDILLTGGSGFVGKNFLKQMAEREDCRIFAIRHRSFVPDTLPGVEWIDVAALDQMEGRRFDAVVHLATSYLRQESGFAQAALENIVFPLRVFDLASKGGCRTIVNADSFFSRTGLDYRYMRPYIQSKRQLLLWGHEYCRQYADMRFLNLRLEHVYGPGDGRDKFLPSVLGRMLRNEECIELTDCVQRRDLVHVDDVARAIGVLLDTSGMETGVLDAGCGTGGSVALREVLEWCAEAVETTSFLRFGALPQREGEIMDSRADISFLHSLGWRPQINWRVGIGNLIRHERSLL